MAVAWVSREAEGVGAGARPKPSTSCTHLDLDFLNLGLLWQVDCLLPCSCVKYIIYIVCLLTNYIQLGMSTDDTADSVGQESVTI